MSKRRASAIVCTIVVVIAIAVILSGKLLAAASGYPKLDEFSSAEIYVYDKVNFTERLEKLSVDEEGSLREALSNICPFGLRSNTDDLESQDGWIGNMFLLTMPEGDRLLVRDVYQHILINNIDFPEKSGAWLSSAHSLASLHGLYESMLVEHQG